MAIVGNPKTSPPLALSASSTLPPPSPLASLRPPPSELCNSETTPSLALSSSSSLSPPPPPLTSLRPPPSELCIRGITFKLTKQIGSGTFGEIYEATNTETNEVVAIKLENNTKYLVRLLGNVVCETSILQTLQGGTGIPSCKGYGLNIGDYNVLVMDLLGPNLQTLFNLCNKKFSLKTVLMIGIQMIDRLEYVHSKFFLHRDIKPDNFVIGSKNPHLVYLIDFGGSAKYMDSSMKHFPYVAHRGHLGVAQSRRDDLEAVGYVLIYFLRGNLPCQEVKGKTSQREFLDFKRVNVSTSIEELCQGKPKEFEYYFKYCRKLRFDEKPNYSYLKTLFSDRFVTEGFNHDYQFDWSAVMSK